MLGLAAAPEIVIAVPSEISPPYSVEGRYPRSHDPQCSGVMVNDSALLCCHARRRPATRLRVTLMTWNGLSRASSRCILKLSFSAKPVNLLALRRSLEAPR